MVPAPSAAPAPAAPSRTARVIDPVLGRAAFTVEIPAGWVFDGAVLRPNLGPIAVYRASTVDGLTGVQLLPRYDSVESTDEAMRRFYSAAAGVTMRPALSAEALLRTIVLPEARPGATVVGPEPMPNIDQIRQADVAANAQFVQRAAATGGVAWHQQSDAFRLRLAYDVAGHPVEESMLAVTTVTDQPVAHGVVHIEQATVTALRAPKGTLDAVSPSLVRIAQSIAPDPDWMAAQNAFAAKQAENTQAEILAMAERYRQANLRVFNASMNSAAAMERARHDGAQGTVNYIRDEKPMIDPETGQAVTVSDQYDYSYVDETGAVVQTNSAAFNPNGQLAGNWVQLQPLAPR
jgi:hypothetical protein